MGCHHKRIYTSKALAERDALRIEEESQEQSRAYKCNLCTFWHVTSQSPGRRKHSRKRQQQQKKFKETIKFKPFADLLKHITQEKNNDEEETSISQCISGSS